MISTGVEISAVEPFEMRPSTENLMQRLPTYIREELQAIAVKKSGMITDSIHRFWIQPQSSIEYEQTFYKGFFGRTYENIMQFYLSDNLKMCVKQHRMKYDEKGNLIDDSDDSEDDQSAEAQFARTFTKYYDEIGEYFPELLRLKELLKLGFISRIIQARYKSQREFASQIENDTALDTYLKEIKEKISSYPTGSHEADEKILKTISNNLCKQLFCKKSTLKPYLIDWLKYNREQALSNYVKQSLIQEKAKLKFTIENLKLFYDDSHDNDQTMGNDSSKCSWVPAGFSSDLNRKVYGGVALVADAKEGSGIKQREEKKPFTKRNAIDVIKSVKEQRSKEVHDKDKPDEGWHSKKALSGLYQIEKAGIKCVTRDNHAKRQIGKRINKGDLIAEQVIDTYRNGREYFDDKNRTYIRYSQAHQVAMALDRRFGRIVTVFKEPKPQTRWTPIPNRGQ